MRITDSQRKLLELLLTPIVRHFVRKSLTIQTLYDVCKSVFIAVAEEELARGGTKVNVSTLSAATGVTRKEVKRIYRDQELPKVRSGISVTSRVIGQWEQSPRFSSKNKTPRTLTYKGVGSEFSELVLSVSRTLEASTVLKDLARIGAVAFTPRGVRLVKDVDRSLDEERWRIELAAQDMDALLKAVNDNIDNPEVTRNLHLHTEADNLYVDALPEAREWLLEEGKKHHRRVRSYLSKIDADISTGENPERLAGGRLVFSSFSYTELPKGRLIQSKKDS
ncbi:MAG: hypothetical protein KDD70_03465 [Bdellovibrionales bacterium]|nr:hypothetical protein [Bdellovibrionales bacterium]